MNQSKLNRAFLILLLAFGVFLAGSYALIYTLKPDDSHSSVNQTPMAPPSGGDFKLSALNGEVTLSNFKGQVVFIYFGYTFCPDICPTNLAQLSMAYRQLSPEQKQNLQILFVSVDPERDTPERLQEYVDYFEADMIGLTGSAQQIAEIARRYGVVYQKVKGDAQNYAVDHSAFTYVVAPSGELKEQLPHASEPQQFIDALNRYSL